jgi:serine/threonine protein kinase
VIAASPGTTTEFRGTFLYIAPDVAIQGRAGDIWAYGMLLWELLTGKRLVTDFGHFGWQTLFAQRRTGRGLPSLDALNEPAKKLRQDCWKLEPDGDPIPPAPRPPFSEIVERICACK